MIFYIGNTDFEWFDFLSRANPEDVNFWRPGGKSNFKVLLPGAPFLFRLKHPYNAIAGLGFFSSHTFLPVSIAWDTFDIRNGCDTFERFQRKISGYRSEWWDENPSIGCTVLTNPVFFRREDWIASPDNWAKSIVQGKSFSTNESTGNRIWVQIQVLLEKYLLTSKVDGDKSQLLLENTAWDGYKLSVLSKVRLGQGAFRVLVTDAYARKCAISGEKTLPVLEAAHIKPYAKSGPHFIANGLLLRSDLHKLFDSGYITVTEQFKIEVSRKIREEFENGKEYYQYHGVELKYLPTREVDRPQKSYVEWHNRNVFRG
jgi:putative restriction endonuclease